MKKPSVQLRMIHAAKKGKFPKQYMFNKVTDVIKKKRKNDDWNNKMLGREKDFNKASLKLETKNEQNN